ncbi:MAG: hypothetical protein KZQ83_03990 [gamma proteobacterium symbiont of Taylorina sp.]|nr:hypothetical protein [gamma proteobacterium symbiont of Taylorina sp.]
MENKYCSHLIHIVSTYLLLTATLSADDSFNNMSVNNDIPVISEPQTNNTLLITGVDYSSGSYGLKHDTDMLYIPWLLKYNHDNWNLSLTFSYIKITGPGGVFGGGDGGVIPTGSGSSDTAGFQPLSGNGNGNGNGNNKPDKNKLTTNEGLGDVLFNITYAVDLALELPFLLEAGTQIKIPVADEKKELGTGEFDWSIYLDFAYNLDSFSPFITLGYKFMGDPDSVNLENIFYTSMGVDYALSQKLHAGVIYDYKEKVLSHSYEISESTIYLNWSVKQDLSLNAYLVKGFSNGSPDLASGLQFSFLF